MYCLILRSCTLWVQLWARISVSASWQLLGGVDAMQNCSRYSELMARMLISIITGSWRSELDQPQLMSRFFFITPAIIHFQLRILMRSGDLWEDQCVNFLHQIQWSAQDNFGWTLESVLTMKNFSSYEGSHSNPEIKMDFSDQRELFRDAKVWKVNSHQKSQNKNMFLWQQLFTLWNHNKAISMLFNGGTG